VARNRKRAKERRSRRPAAGPATRPGVATARADRDRHEGERHDAERVGRDPELQPGELEESQPLEESQSLEESESLEGTPAPLDHATPDAELAEAQLAMGRPAPDDSDSDLDDAGFEAGGELAHSSGTAAASRGGPGNRLITFLQGSWRELQRVQWPDRRQVMQATGVVVGFVIVAGLYLGLADTVASKLVNLILK
jgi:preprotein translocase subunit SecE